MRQFISLVVYSALYCQGHKHRLTYYSIHWEIKKHSKAMESGQLSRVRAYKWALPYEKSHLNQSFVVFSRKAVYFFGGFPILERFFLSFYLLCCWRLCGYFTNANDFVWRVCGKKWNASRKLLSKRFFPFKILEEWIQFCDVHHITDRMHIMTYARWPFI